MRFPGDVKAVASPAPFSWRSIGPAWILPRAPVTVVGAPAIVAVIPAMVVFPVPIVITAPVAVIAGTPAVAPTAVVPAAIVTALHFHDRR